MQSKKESYFLGAKQYVDTYCASDCKNMSCMRNTGGKRYEDWRQTAIPGESKTIVLYGDICAQHWK